MVPVDLLLPSEGPDLTAEPKVRRIVAGEHNKTLQASGCPITAQVRITSSTTDSAVWMLQSLDTRGNPKTVGGDEYYVTFQYNEAKDITAAAHAIDHKDGTYKLQFTTTPLDPFPTPTTPGTTQEGTLKVYFQYSCGIGTVPRPVRDHWDTNGATRLVQELRNVPRPPWNHFDPTTVRNSPTTDNGPIDFGNHRMVILFGDSLCEKLSRTRK